MNRLPLIAVITTVFHLILANADAAQSFTFQNGVGGYSGTLDTQIRGATPDRKDGNLTELNPDGSDDGRPVQALIRFADIFGTEPGQIPPGASILFASLTVYIANEGDSPALHTMLKDWNEGTTWNSIGNPKGTGIRIGVEAAEEPEVVFEAGGNVPYYREIALPGSTLQDWLDGKSPNYGWAIIPSGNNGVDFPSSENRTIDWRPKLTIVTGEDGEPLVLGFASSPSGFQFELQDGVYLNGKPNPIDLSSIHLALDGQAASPSIVRDNDSMVVSHSPPGFFQSESTHSVRLEFTDSASPPRMYSVEEAFDIGQFQTLPAWAAVSGVDTSQPGFSAHVSQIGGPRAPGNRNSTENAERQLANEIIDPATNQPYENLADNYLADANGRFPIVDVINWEELGRAAGNFRDNSDPPRPDDFVPGIPGVFGESDNFVVEILTFLELERGFYRFGVNSDDGFKLTAGTSPTGALAFELGEFNGGRGAADTVIEFAAAQDGYYPFRLIWWNGSGGASVEFFSIDPLTGERVLVNDPASAGSIRAFRTGPEAPPYTLSIAPAPGQTEVPPNAGIEILLRDTTREIWTASIRLFVNGRIVAPTVEKSGATTSVTYRPPNGLPRSATTTVRIEYADTGSASELTAQEFSFQTASSVPVVHTFREGVNGYAGTQDTMFREGAPNENYGNAEALSIDRADGGGENHVLIRFENLSGSGPGQIPLGSIVKSASLTLRLFNPGDNARLHRMLKPWREWDTWTTFDRVSSNGVTADNVEASARPDAIIDGGDPVPVFATVDLPVETIQQWLDGATPNYGWVFVPGGTNGVDFDTSEAGELNRRPTLTIVIEEVDESPGNDALTLAIERSAAGVTLRFDGVLQSADQAIGPYSDVLGASSPLAVPVSEAPKFFRTRR